MEQQGDIHVDKARELESDKTIERVIKRCNAETGVCRSLACATAKREQRGKGKWLVQTQYAADRSRPCGFRQINT